MSDTTPIIGTTKSRTIKESGAFVVLAGEGTVIAGDVFAFVSGGTAGATAATVGSGVIFLLPRYSAPALAVEGLYRVIARCPVALLRA
jgi:hypothetical protein